jgi:8-oxo-dGTP diphosphatase
VADRRIVVAAAVVERASHYLVTRRLAGTHLEGFWEFPGGKCEPDETVADCLIREIREELGCEISIGDEIFSVSHEYPDRTVDLHFFRCHLHGEPQPLLGQEIRWISRTELSTLDFPPADQELIALLATSEREDRRSR